MRSGAHKLYYKDLRQTNCYANVHLVQMIVDYCKPFIIDSTVIQIVYHFCVIKFLFCRSLLICSCDF